MEKNIFALFLVFLCHWNAYMRVSYGCSSVVFALLPSLCMIALIDNTVNNSSHENVNQLFLEKLPLVLKIILTLYNLILWLFFFYLVLSWVYHKVEYIINLLYLRLWQKIITLFSGCDMRTHTVTICLYNALLAISIQSISWWNITYFVFEQIRKCNKWHQMTPNDTEWHQMTPNDTKSNKASVAVCFKIHKW